MRYSFEAGADLSSHQYHAVQLDEDFRVDVITDANAPQLPIGILQNDPVSGEAAEVALPGEICFAEAGTTITFGQELGMNNDGELIPAAQETGPATADLYVFAIALEDAADGEHFKVLVISPLLASTE